MLTLAGSSAKAAGANPSANPAPRTKAYRAAVIQTSVAGSLEVGRDGRQGHEPATVEVSITSPGYLNKNDGSNLESIQIDRSARLFDFPRSARRTRVAQI